MIDIAVTRYAAPYVEGTDDRELRRRAELLQTRLNTDPLYAEDDANRRHRIENDPSLPDWLKNIFLDRTILDNDQLKNFFGVSIQKVWDLSAPLQAKRRPRPHPRMTPEHDVFLKVVGGRQSPGLQLGKAAEWWVASGRGLVDVVNETLVANEAPLRHGRTRGPEVIEDHWFDEHAARIRKVKSLVKDWTDDPLSTTITALLELHRAHPELDIQDRTVASQVSRCMRVLRSKATAARKSKQMKKTPKKKGA